MQKLLSIEEVMKITGKSKSTIYRRTAKGKFPKPVEVPSKTARGPKTKKTWPEKEIRQWVFEPAQQENIARQVQSYEEDINPFSNSPWTNLPDAPKWYVKHKFLVLAAIGGLLAGIIGNVWG